MKKYLMSSLLLLLVGCTSNDNEMLSASTDEEQVCEYIAKTGSNLKKKKCMSKSLAQELDRQNKHDLRDAMRKGQTQAHTK